MVLDFLTLNSVEEISPLARTSTFISHAVKKWLARPREVVVLTHPTFVNRERWVGAIKACACAKIYLRKYLRSQIHIPEYGQYLHCLRDGSFEEYPIPYKPLLASLAVHGPNRHLISVALCKVPAPAIDCIVRRTPNLRVLSLLMDRNLPKDSAEIVPNYPHVFAACPKLEKLTLNVSRLYPITKYQSVYFYYLRNLRELELMDTAVDKEAIPWMFDCLPHKTLVSLKWQHYVGEVSELFPFLGKLSELEVFIPTSLRRCTVSDLEQLNRLLPNLTEFSLCDTDLHHVAENSMTPIYPRIKKLSLHVRDEENTRTIMQRAVNLEYLHIHVLDDGDLYYFPRSITTHLTKLRTLKFWFATFDIDFHDEFTSLPSLENVSFYLCDFGDSHPFALDAFWRNFGSTLHGATFLKTIEFLECEVIRAEFINLFLRQFTNRKLENLHIDMVEEDWNKYEDAPGHGFVKLFNDRSCWSDKWQVHRNVFETHVVNYKIEMEHLGSIVNGVFDLRTSEQWDPVNPEFSEDEADGMSVNSAPPK